MSVPVSTTTDGYEVQMGTNHIGHAFLAKLLLPTLETNAESSDTRIVVLSSQGGQFARGINYKVLKNDGSDMILLGGTQLLYCQSKLANIYYADQLAIHHPTITSVSIHPGIVQTNLVISQTLAQRAFIKVSTLWSGAMKTPAQGAYNTVWASTVTKDKLNNGAYYEPVGLEVKGSKFARDEKAAEQLWEWTEKELESWML